MLECNTGVEALIGVHGPDGFYSNQDGTAKHINGQVTTESKKRWKVKGAGRVQGA